MKSRMPELGTFGSVRGGLSVSQGTNIVTLPLRKREDNRGYKAVPKVKRYPSTRLSYLNK